MKQSDIQPGILFLMPGKHSSKVYRFHKIGEDTLVIRKHGYFQGVVGVIGKVLETEDYECWHFDVKPNGIQLWQVADTVYLKSKVIPFSELTKFEQITPATNPISI